MENGCGASNCNNQTIPKLYTVTNVQVTYAKLVILINRKNQRVKNKTTFARVTICQTSWYVVEPNPIISLVTIILNISIYYFRQLDRLFARATKKKNDHVVG